MGGGSCRCQKGGGHAATVSQVRTPVPPPAHRTPQAGKEDAAGTGDRVGVHEDTLARYERGVRRVQPHNLDRLIQELELENEEAALLRAAWAHDEPYWSRGVSARLLNKGEAETLDRGEGTGAVASSGSDPITPPPWPYVTVEPILPGAQELEALITRTGDEPSADGLVRSSLKDVHLLAFGQLDEWGLAHLLRCTVPVGTTAIRMLPVFTRLEYVATALRLNPAWREMQVIEVAGVVAFGDLDPHECLGINLWSSREFKLPATSGGSRGQSVASRPRRFFFFRRRRP